MLIVRPVSPQVVPYFLDGPGSGKWSESSRRLLRLPEEVTRSDLRKVLQGRDPATGRFLPAVKPARRRAGWDLIFCAPKSVSLLHASSAPQDGSVARSHAAAVGAVLGYLEETLSVSRRDSLGRPVAADGLVVASFEHRENAASEPHLHTHALIANLTHAGDRWCAVRNNLWHTDRQALAALYQLELRRQLDDRGWDLEWRIRPDGLADLAGISREAVRAASTQTLRVGQTDRYRARRQAVAQPWRRRLDELPATATSTLRSARGRDRGPGSDRAPLQIEHPVGSNRRPAPEPTRLRTGGDGESLTRVVTTRLAARRSDFRRADVVVALASSYQGGAHVKEALAWVQCFCDDSIPVASPTSGRRWTSDLAKGIDDAVADGLLGAGTAARERASPSLPHRARSHVVTAGQAPDQVLAALALAPAAEECARLLVESAHPVSVLTCPPGESRLLAQAEIVDACRVAWAESGLRVAVASPDAASHRRWEVLTGLEPFRTGRRFDVVIVDQADRRASHELLQLAGTARSGTSRLVLVEGGTMPCLTNPTSHGFAVARGQLSRLDCGDHEPWSVAAPGYPQRDLGRERTIAPRRRPGLDGPSVAAPPATGPFPGPAGPGGRPGLTGRRAAEQILASWRSAPEAGVPLLVGLGLEEVRALNRAAGAIARGRPSRGAGVNGFVPGDRVVVVRGGFDHLTYGSFGSIEAIREDRVVVRWDEGSEARSHDVLALARMRHGWAVGPYMAGRSDRPLALLGPSSALAKGRERVVAEIRAPAREGPEMARTPHR